MPEGTSSPKSKRASFQACAVAFIVGVWEVNEINILVLIAVHLRLPGEVNRPHCLGTMKTWLFQENIGDIGEPKGQIRSKHIFVGRIEVGATIPTNTNVTPRHDCHSNDANDV